MNEDKNLGGRDVRRVPPQPEKGQPPRAGGDRRREAPAVAVAFGALSDLVEETASAGGAPGAGELRRRMERWYAGACQSNPKLAEASRLALEYELGREGLLGDEARAAASLGALSALWDARSGPVAAEESGVPVEVEVAEEIKRAHPKRRYFRLRDLSIITEPEESGWHASVSHPSRYPTVEELFASWAATGKAPGHLWAPAAVEGSGPYAAGRLVHLFERVPSNIADAVALDAAAKGGTDGR